MMRGLSLILAVLASAGVTTLATAAQTLSPAEKLYAELSKLPPAQRQARLEAAARKEGKLVLINTMREQNKAQAAMFKKRYPFIDLHLIGDIGSQDAAERIYAEETAGRHITDEFVGARADLDALLSADMLARYPTPMSKVILPKYRDFTDPQNRWLPFYWSAFVITYNTNLVPPGKAPKSWQDLCKPFFKHNVSFEPAEVRFLAGLYTMLGDEGTKKYIKCLGANDPIVQRGHTLRMHLMLAGSNMVAADEYPDTGMLIKRKNPSAPFGAVLTAPIISIAGVVAINRNAPDPAAAALSADWLMSRESQQFISDQLRGPIALKHPFLPDNAKLVIVKDVAPAEMTRLIDYWKKYMGK